MEEMNGNGLKQLHRMTRIHITPTFLNTFNGGIV